MKSQILEFRVDQPSSWNFNKGEMTKLSSSRTPYNLDSLTYSSTTNIPNQKLEEESYK